MPTIQQLLESQEKEFEDNLSSIFYRRETSGVDCSNNKNTVFNWHKQSIIALYQAEITICKEEIEQIKLRKNGEYDAWSDGVIDTLESKLSHYQQVIEELRK